MEERREAWLPHAGRLEQNRLVEHHDVDAGELLQHGEEDGREEVRPVAPPEQGPPRPLHLLRRLAFLHQFPELGVDVLGAGEKARADRHDRRRHDGQPERSAPPLILSVK